MVTDLVLLALYGGLLVNNKIVGRRETMATIVAVFASVSICSAFILKGIVGVELFFRVVQLCCFMTASYVLIKYRYFTPLVGALSFAVLNILMCIDYVMYKIAFDNGVEYSSWLQESFPHIALVIHLMIIIGTWSLPDAIRRRISNHFNDDSRSSKAYKDGN